MIKTLSLPLGQSTDPRHPSGTLVFAKKIKTKLNELDFNFRLSMTKTTKILRASKQENQWFWLPIHSLISLIHRGLTSFLKIMVPSLAQTVLLGEPNTGNAVHRQAVPQILRDISSRTSEAHRSNSQKKVRFNPVVRMKYY